MQKILLPPIRVPCEQVQALILSWYATHQRDLPWRRTSNPYHILVSEFMLQQTQVERVLPKYVEFLAAFPTLEALAVASTAEIIRVWSPLGYNLRPLRLQEIARQVVTFYKGQIPQTIAELLSLKGIGRYTAGAIACFAYRKEVAMLDTNIRRVLHRVVLGWEYPAPLASEKQLLALGEKMLPAGRAYDWNQALMDFGATICTTNTPACARCPVQTLCLAAPSIAQARTTIPGTSLLAVRERKATYQTQPFKQTTRYYRGRIIAALRTLPTGAQLALDELGAQLKADYDSQSDGDRAWLTTLVRKLERDGLVRLHESDSQMGLSFPD